MPLAHPMDPVWVVARSTADPQAMVAALRETVAGIDPDLLRAEVTTGASLVDRSVGDFLRAFMVSGMFAAIALVLAALGIYGVVAFAVAKLALPGVVGGLVLVSLFLRLKTDIPPTTPALLVVVFAAAVAAAFAFVILASLGPALRAAGVQPAQAMRMD